MEIVNIVEKQLRTEMDLEMMLAEHRDFFTEYFQTFGEREEFIKYTGLMLENSNSDDVRIKIDKIISVLKILEPRINEYMTKKIDVGVILFAGVGSWDGHGILINGKPYIFFDLTAMVEMMNNPGFRLDFHLTHEFMHAIHYYFAPEFYPGNYQNVRDRYLKRMLAEGVASYLTSWVLRGEVEDYLWFGLLNHTAARQWMRIARNERQVVWATLRRLVDDQQEDITLTDKLFSIKGFGMNDLLTGRFGYYYGYDIARSVAEDLGVEKLFNMKLIMYKEYTESYFTEID